MKSLLKKSLQRWRWGMGMIDGGMNLLILEENAAKS
jgi:hypothetical protein